MLLRSRKGRFTLETIKGIRTIRREAVDPRDPIRLLNTGFFEEPWPKAASYDSRDKMRVYGVVVDKLKQLGAKPLYLLPSERSASAADSINRVIVRESEAEKEVTTNEAAETAEDTQAEAAEGESASEDGGGTAAAASGQYDYDKRIALPEGTPEYCASGNRLGNARFS